MLTASRQPFETSCGVISWEYVNALTNLHVQGGSRYGAAEQQFIYTCQDVIEILKGCNMKY